MADERRALGGLVGQEQVTPRALFASLGGVLGIVESMTPALVFVVAYTFGKNLWLAAAATGGLVAVFAVIRLARRESLLQVGMGAFVAAIGLGFALVTGRAGNNFLPGIIYNAVLIVVFIGSILVRRPIIGILLGTVFGDARAWREDPLLARASLLTTWLWAGVMAIRVAVLLPLYLSSVSTGEVVALGIAKIATGVPLLTLQLLLSWAILRPAYVVSEAQPGLDVGEE